MKDASLDTDPALEAQETRDNFEESENTLTSTLRMAGSTARRIR